MGVGKYLSHEDLIAAFTLRSKRLVTQEILSCHIAEARARTKKSSGCCLWKKISSASENKRQLASFVLPVVNSAAFENFFQNPKAPLLQRLQRLAQLAGTGAPLQISSMCTARKSPARWTDLAVHDGRRAPSCLKCIEARNTQPCRKGPDAC